MNEIRLVQQQKSFWKDGKAPLLGVVEVYENGKLTSSCPVRNEEALLYILNREMKKGLLFPK